MIYLRTPQEKANPRKWWKQPDEIFFSAGACHVLVSVFLSLPATEDFWAILINPKEGYRGGHVVAASDSSVFDAQGYSMKQKFLDDYFSEMRDQFHGWDAEVITLRDDPAGWEFCDEYHHRHPSQFSGDVMARATRYSSKLAAETAVR